MNKTSTALLAICAGLAMGIKGVAPGAVPVVKGVMTRGNKRGRGTPTPRALARVRKVRELRRRQRRNRR